MYFETCRPFLRVLLTFIRIPKWELSPGHRLGKSLNSGNNKVFKPGKPMNDMTVIRNWARNVPKKQRIVVSKNLFIVLGIEGHPSCNHFFHNGLNYAVSPLLPVVVEVESLLFIISSRGFQRIYRLSGKFLLSRYLLFLPMSIGLLHEKKFFPSGCD